MIKRVFYSAVCKCTRSPCFWEQQEFMWQLLLSNSWLGHSTTRDPHPGCSSRPFCSSTCHCAVYLALPSLLRCGITPPGLHSSHHLIDLPTSDQSELQSRQQSSLMGWTSPSTRRTKTPQAPFTAVSLRQSPFDLRWAVILLVFYFLLSCLQY